MGETALDRRSGAGSLGLSRTVRDAAFDVFRRRGLTTLFSNPGSTEVPFLAGLPDELTFVLALHEGSVVSMATGFAIGRGEPALAVVHTTAGLGNAVGALATARVNKAPLVVFVGQQDRRHLVFEPFLAGRLDGLAGEYPVSVEQPVRPQEVPGAVERAYHAAATQRGPALVIVPMDDWDAPAEDAREDAAAGRVLRAAAVDPAAVDALAEFLSSSTSPALVVGAGADDAETWAALVELAERLVVPVFQESFGARAGFPQDHPLFAGFLPADRPRLRETLAPFDALLVVGAPVFRQSPYAPGRFTEPGARIAVVSADADEVHRSPAELAVLAPPAAVCRELASRVPARDVAPPEPREVASSAGAAGGRRADARRPRARGARGTPAARRRRRRRGARRPARAARATSPHANRSASSAQRWEASVSRSAARPACAWRFPSVRSSRSSATAPRSTGSRRCGAPRTTASAFSL